MIKEKHDDDKEVDDDSTKRSMMTATRMKRLM